jgi:hypothetical protein
MPPRRLRITRWHARAAVRWGILAVLVSLPLFFTARFLVPAGPGPAVWLPELGRSVIGIVEAATPGGGAVATKPKASIPLNRVAGSARRPDALAAAVAGSRTLTPVVSAACTSCRVLRDGTTGAIRVTLGSAQRTAAGSAFALLDFGGLGGAGGVVRVHDRIGLDRGDVPQSDLSVLQVTDVENRVAYRLQIDRLTRVLRLVSPPGGLNRSGLDVSTSTQVPDDGVHRLTVDVAAQAGRSIVVQVDGRTVISRQALSDGDALRQRFLAVGILNSPASMTTLSVTHDALQVAVGSGGNSDPAGVSTVGLQLSPAVSLVPPANLTPPTIAGDDVTGAPLTASLGTWSDSNGLRIRWSRCAADGTGCQQITDVNGASYVPDSGDVGSTFLITVTASNDAGTAVATSTLTPVVGSSRPLIVTGPSIGGDAVEGATLTASPGTWAWRNGSFGYEWQRCDANGTACATIDGETASSHVLGRDDVGSTVRVLVSAPGLTTATTAAARATDVVRLAAPFNLAAPVVAGNAVTGAVLSATPGDWTDASAAYTYAWERCSAAGTCLPIAGADGNAYRVGIEDLGSALRVSVSAANAGGVGTASSTVTAAVTLGAPASSTRPTISGDAIVGSTLTVNTGTWTDSQATITIAWQRCAADGTNCATIDGATATTYVLTGNDAGSTITAVVTASNAGGSAGAASAATATVAEAHAPPAPAAPANATPPTVVGDAIVGSTLTVDTGTWTDPQAAITISWQRCAADGTNCLTIDGATATTYTLTAADAGSTIEAVVTATNAGGSTAAASAATAPVTDAPAPPAPATEPAAASDLTQLGAPVSP